MGGGWVSAPYPTKKTNDPENIFSFGIASMLSNRPSLENIHQISRYMNLMLWYKFWLLYPQAPFKHSMT